ncbi:MAG: hypothetical protein AAF479_16765 [Pseudomonadota bacterium]
MNDTMQRQRSCDLSFHHDTHGEIRVLFEDPSPSVGRFTIWWRSYVWTHCWNAMGGLGVVDFFQRATSDYIIGKIIHGPSVVVDWGKINRAIGTCPRTGDEPDCRPSTAHLYATRLEELYGADWPMDLPTKPNEIHVSAHQVVDAIKVHLAANPVDTA